MTKNFSNGTTNYGEVGTGTSYWAGYLNDTTTNGWYGSISAEYKKMLVQGTYYLGQYLNGVSYKNSICSENNTTKTTKECSKLSGSAVWTGLVGLTRVGEMFSSQLGEGFSSSSNMWLITPYSSSNVRAVNSNGGLYADLPSTAANGVRPSITLNPNVYITSGEGTEQKPYDIKCDSCS